MAIIYELLDLSTGNLVAIFETEEAALTSIRRTLDRHGPDAVLTLALGTVDDAGDGEQLAAGNALIARALAEIAHR